MVGSLGEEGEAGKACQMKIWYGAGENGVREEGDSAPERGEEVNGMEKRQLGTKLGFTQVTEEMLKESKLTRSQQPPRRQTRQGTSFII